MTKRDSPAVSDLRHVSFEGMPSIPYRGRGPTARGRDGSCGVSPAAPEPQDEFLAWVLGRAGLAPELYRSGPLLRRLPACLRALRARSRQKAREVLEERADLLPAAISSLLIGVTEFFRDPAVFENLRTQVLPELARRPGPLRIWSAACSSGAELYSVAILLAEAGLLERCFLLGTDCRTDAIEEARAACYSEASLRLIEPALRRRYLERACGDPWQNETPDCGRPPSLRRLCGRRRGMRPGRRASRTPHERRVARSPRVPAFQAWSEMGGGYWRPVEVLRRRVHWKLADLLADVEDGPWDVILWRNVAIYVNPEPAAAVWGRLASVLAPGGVLVAGKAERPPRELGLVCTCRGAYRFAGGYGAGGGDDAVVLGRVRHCRRGNDTLARMTTGDAEWMPEMHV